MTGAPRRRRCDAAGLGRVCPATELDLKPFAVVLAEAFTDRRVLDDADQSAHAVAPSDLLALGVGSTGVRDADLVDAESLAGQLGRDLGLEAEPILLDLDRLDDLAPEHLVARLHVGQVQVGEHVRQQRQALVADRVPEVQHPVRPARQEPRAVDDVGDVGCQRLDEVVVLGRVVLEVGVLDEHELGGGEREAGAQRRALALVVVVEHDADTLVGHTDEQVAGAVGRAIVDDEDLGDPRRFEHALDERHDGRVLVVAGHDDGEATTLMTRHEETRLLPGAGRWPLRHAWVHPPRGHPCGPSSDRPSGSPAIRRAVRARACPDDGGPRTCPATPRSGRVGTA